MRSKGERCRNVAKIMGWVVTGRERHGSLFSWTEGSEARKKIRKKQSKECEDIPTPHLGPWNCAGVLVRRIPSWYSVAVISFSHLKLRSVEGVAPPWLDWPSIDLPFAPKLDPSTESGIAGNPSDPSVWLLFWTHYPTNTKKGFWQTRPSFLIALDNVLLSSQY